MTQQNTQIREVWFLTGSQGMYGEATLRQVAEQSQALVRVLDEAGLPVRILWKPVLTDAPAIRRIIRGDFPTKLRLLIVCLPLQLRKEQADGCWHAARQQPA